MSDESDQWNCPMCTLANELTTEACDACGATSPLVLAGYEAEEQAALAASSAHSSPREKSKKPSARGRGVSQDSLLSDAMSEDIAAELDPWTQAEFEWANVEALQDTKTTPKKPRK
jgi:hypothetical protein